MRFRSKKGRNGKRVSYPISGKKGGGYKEPPMKVRKMPNPWGSMARRQIRRGEGEADLLPNVSHEVDEGWLAFMERIHYKQLDEDERQTVGRLVEKAETGSTADRAIAMTELEHRYPDAYEHAFGKEADIPRTKGEVIEE